jgi:SecD/SecF fusion protein
MVEKLNRKLTMVVVALVAAIIVQFVLPFRLGLDLEGGTRLTYSVDIDAARQSEIVSQEQSDQEVMSELVSIWIERVDPYGTKGITLRRVGSNRVVIEIPGSASAVANDVASKLAKELSKDGNVIELDLGDEANWDRFPPTGGVVRIGAEDIQYRRRTAHLLTDLYRGQTRTEAAAHEAGATVQLIAADPWKSLIENTGRMEFFIQANDSDDLLGVSDTRTELEKAKAWIDANEDLPIADYNLKLATENPDSPIGRLRFFPMKPTEFDLAQGLVGKELLKKNLTALIVEADPEWRFTGSDMAAVRQTTDDIGFPAVGFEIKGVRGNAFGAYTRAHIDKSMAIVINDEIVTMPNIEDALVGGGTINGGARGFKEQEVQDLIQVLKSGSLKISPKFESEESVGATLGADYVRRGTISSIAALAVVIVFGIVYYRLLGVITAISLGFNLLLLLGAMRLMQTTLTLPGVAGIVLTVGMAIDANILIFERFREELLKGRKPIQAAKDGFHNALSTILDSNLTTLLTGIILFYEGSGPVKGFAATLCIGIVTTLFSALLVTRLLMHFAFERGVENFKMLRFVGETNIPFLSKTRVCAIGSAIVLTAGVVLFSILPNHEKLGIDFIGGNTMTIVTAKPESKDTVTAAVQGIDETFRNAAVQEIKSSSEGDGFRQFRIEFKSGSDQEAGDGNLYRAAVQRALGDMLSPIHIEVVNNLGEVSGTLHFEQEHPVADLKERLAGAGLTEVDVQDAPDTSGSTYRFTARTAATAQNATLFGGIESAFANKRDSAETPYTWERPIPQSESVGPQVVQELRDKAIFAILLSLFAVVMYIRVRFSEYSYGLAAVAALVHDVLFTLGALAVAVHFDIVEAEVNLTMIAAFLTIIGYSLNDTIVIFDRVRENLPKYKRPLAEIIDLSLNQTLSRTLLTSGTTLMAVVVMFAFNVGTRNALESFGFAMIIGIFSGTYSTIYISSPVLLWLETRRLAKGGAPVTAVVPTPVSDTP